MSTEGETRPIWYHGGVPGLGVGEMLLPPSVTGAKSLRDWTPPGADGSHIRRDRVFLTRDLNAAMMFAALYPVEGGGWCYLCLPVGED